MKNKANIGLLPAVFLLICFLMTFAACSEKKQEQPNIIFLLADDLKADALGFMGNAIVRTPHIDALAGKGTVFRNTYATTAICAISRASIFSGQYSIRHGIRDFTTTFSDSAFAMTYPALFRHNGYYTGFIGKYGVGSPLPKDKFDYWEGFGGMGAYYYKTGEGDSIHSTDRIGKQMITFLETRDRSKPFCLSVSFKAPHTLDGSTVHNGFIYSPEFESYYTDDSIPFPANGDDSYYLSFPPLFRTNEQGVENEARKRWELRFSTKAKYQETVKAYYRLISGIDKVVGNLVDELRKQGADKNTIIVFTADNGFYLGEHGLAGKWYGHEESIRIPLVVYDPRADGSRRVPVSDAIALNIDMAPTLLEYAGIPVPPGIQGKSLRSLMEGDTTGWRTEFYYDHLFDPPKVHIPKSEGIVRKNYKYIRYFNGNNPDDFFYEELFNTALDPSEIHNLSEDSGMAALKSQLVGQMKTYRQQLK